VRIHVPQRVDIGDRLTTSGEHHRHVHPHLAAVMARGETPPRERRRQAAGEPDPVCE
jgi:hypothetical protein